MPTLYVTEPEARLEKEYGRLLVTKHDETLFRAPISRVDEVVLIGRAGATTAALHALLDHNIPLLLINRSGRLRGRLLPPTAANLPLRMAQYARNDDPRFCLELARALIEAKIHNQRTLALRLARRRDDLNVQAELLALRQSKNDAGRAADLPELLGVEGNAARVYFSIYRQALRAPWVFSKRVRRPPTDPVNALLSLGYSMLTHAAMAALEVAGLDPYLGFFHAEKYGRPALALDLVEEFRAPIIDSLTLNLLNHHTLDLRDFEQQGRAVYLTRPGLHTYLQHFSKQLESEIKVRDLGRALSYRKLLEVQARRFAAVISGAEDAYRPFRAR